MRRLPPILLLLLAALSCTEKVDLRSRSDYHGYLCVDAVLTDRADRAQQVVLSRTVSYFEEEELPRVRGASVSVDEVVFRETDPGVYQAPEGYACSPGRTYHLKISLPDGAEYEAEASMPEPGFRLDAIDYAYAGNKTSGLDSLWTLAIWGRDEPADSYYNISLGVNGTFYPFSFTETVDDKYFNGKDVGGFPIATLIQTAGLQERYGDCFKYLETGDVITLEALTIDRGYYDFLLAMMLNGTSIPIFSPQPVNAPTNLRGDHVLGWFAVCPVVDASVTVDDPLRPYYRKMMPGW